MSLPTALRDSRQRRQYARRLRRPAWLGTLRRTTPLSDHWGFDRGTPVDRYYIERFLATHSRDIRGRVLEVKDSAYTDRYGTDVRQRDVLDIRADNPRATVVVDLAAADSIPSDSFDCFILTQTLQFIFDLRSAIAHAHRILGPGGVLLATVPSVSRIDWKSGLMTDYWRLTVASCTRLFGEPFGLERIAVRSHGNVLTATAFLMGMASEELSPRELDHPDDYFPVVITVRAQKA